jgi:thiamine pyrophosphokinase
VLSTRKAGVDPLLKKTISSKRAPLGAGADRTAGAALGADLDPATGIGDLDFVKCN